MSVNQEEKNNRPFDLEDQKFMKMTIHELLLLKHQYELDKDKVEDYKKALQVKEQLVAVMERFHEESLYKIRAKIEKAFYLLERNKLTKLSRLLSKMTDL